MTQVLQPPGWARPRGYANGIATEGGKLVFIAGQIGWNEQCVFTEKGFGGQFRQTLKNILAVLAEAGGRPEHIVRLTWYVVDKQEYLAAGAEVGAAYRELMGRNFPAMAVVQVVALVEDEARLEIEAMAVVPAQSSAKAHT
jgi:enamine deaminase RidA (YjgF/YER057c/UK114 family)